MPDLSKYIAVVLEVVHSGFVRHECSACSSQETRKTENFGFAKMYYMYSLTYNWRFAPILADVAMYRPMRTFGRIERCHNSVPRLHSPPLGQNPCLKAELPLWAGTPLGWAPLRAWTTSPLGWPPLWAVNSPLGWPLWGPPQRRPSQLTAALGLKAKQTNSEIH